MDTWCLRVLTCTDSAFHGKKASRRFDKSESEGHARLYPREGHMRDMKGHLKMQF